MLSDAFVNAECDRCGEVSEPIMLTRLAMRGSWDERSVKHALKRMGWLTDGDKHVCDACVDLGFGLEDA